MYTLGSRICIVTALVACCAQSALAQQRAPQDAAHTLVEAYNASGVALFGQFSSTSGNIVFSPYSIGSAMAMVLAGARGETEREMAGVLKLRLTPAEIDAANDAVRRVLAGYDKSGEPPHCRDGFTLVDNRCEGTPNANGNCSLGGRREGSLCVAPPVIAPSASVMIANALMLTGRGDLVAADYVALLRDKYGAEILQNAGLAEVNGWVNRKTEGKIDRILNRLDPSNAAAVLDAIYFKAKWATHFSKGATKDEPFNLSREQRVEVPTMHLRARLAVSARADYRAIRLPYEIGALAMIILLPNEVDGLAGVTQRIDAGEWAEVAEALRAAASEKLVDLALPRFKATFSADLVPSFVQQGMTRAFDTKLADFSGITGHLPSETPAAIGAILHRAIIDVMEDGTEAAAATAVTVSVLSAPRPQQPEVFQVDRPFLFALIDNASGAILFQGRIVDPR